MAAGSTSPISRLASYSDLFAKILDPVFLLGAERFEVLEMNQAAERMCEDLGLKIVGGEIATFFDGDGRREFGRLLRVVRRSYHPRTLVSQWKVPNAADIAVSLSACSLRLSNGQDVVQLIARDITPLRRAEAEAERYLTELKALNLKLEEISIKDELTGLGNIRAFRSELAREHARAARHKKEYSIIFCDVDHFKKYNDRNGHPAGDKVLAGIGATIRNCVRNTDVPIRYGGEEFVILCPETGALSTRPLAERLLKSVASFPFDHREHQPLGSVTLSIGIASYPNDGTEAAAVVAAADGALYRSKAAGRNRLTFSRELMGPPA